MKFRVIMKTPDAMEDACREVAEINLSRRSEDEGGDCSAEDTKVLIEEQSHTLANFACKWMRHGELVTLEFDTEADTCVVVPMR